MVMRWVAWLVAWPLRALAGVVLAMLTGRGTTLLLDVEGVTEAADAAQLALAVRRVIRAPKVRGLVIRLRELPGGWALTSDLREAIAAVVASGREVTVVLEEAGTQGWWLATAASRVVLVPQGTLTLSPLGGEMTFLGEALDRLGVDVDVISAGAYKAAGEPMTRSWATPENLEATEALVADLREAVVTDIAASRGMTPDAVRAALGGGPWAASEAHEAGLVDALAYDDEVIDAIAGNTTGAGTWLRWRSRADRWATWGRADVVAVLHLQGPVVMEDPSGRPAIAARDIVPVVDALREDARVRAVVLHIDTSGGSALASDLIWRAVARLVEDKPVVASMADTAASGGYYIAAPARHIVARPTSLTGSIGVVGGKPSVQRLLRGVGVRSQPIGEGAGMNSLARPLSAPLRERLQATMRVTYQGFVERVAAGRGRTVEEVEPVCRGRVWSGASAARVGLVDALGGLDTAIMMAAGEADAADGVPVVHLVARSGPPWARLARRVMGASARLIGPVGEVAAPALAWSWLTREAGRPLAWWPFELRVR